jgi:hypothetical protein
MANPFVHARPFVWDGQGQIGQYEKYLCHAVQRAADSKAVSQKEADQAVAMIQVRLGEHATVVGWLYNEAGITFTEMNDCSVQSYRLFWLADLSVKWNQGERK